MKHRQRQDEFMLKIQTYSYLTHWFACLTFNVGIPWNLNVSCGNSIHLFLSLLYTIPVSPQVTSAHVAFFNKKSGFDQISCLFKSTETLKY